MESVSETKFDREDAEALDELGPGLVASRDLADVRVVLKTLQSLCDLEFARAQNLMREQPENVKSVNVVAEVCQFLSLLYTNIDQNYVDLVSDLLETITEFIQGNQENQAVVFDNKVIDYLNHMLRAEDFPHCTVDEILRLKWAIGTVIRFMTEENQVWGLQKITVIVCIMNACLCSCLFIRCFTVVW